MTHPCKHAFEAVFEANETGIYKKDDALPTDLSLVAEYIGHLLHHALCIHQDYKNKKASVIDHLTSYQEADEALAAFIRSFGVHSIQTTNPKAFRLMQRFIETDSL